MHAKMFDGSLASLSIFNKIKHTHTQNVQCYMYIMYGYVHEIDNTELCTCIDHSLYQIEYNGVLLT